MDRSFAQGMYKQKTDDKKDNEPELEMDNSLIKQTLGQFDPYIVNFVKDLETFPPEIIQKYKMEN